MSDSKSKLRKGTTKKEVSTSSSSSTCSWSSDDDSDPVVLKAIKDYLSDRTELANQLFRSVKREKIRMMLPQILKKIDMAELEELCASELCGMSTSRILSILNGTPMINSSDTSESDDSGPSLEIISDTEAWVSDGEQQSYCSSSNRDKSKISKRSKMPATHNGCTSVMSKSRGKTRVCNRNQSNIIKVKKEKELLKCQGGESLLDLLELEMRARAIKALIRKEENIVSTLGCEQHDTMDVNVLKGDVPTALPGCSILRESNSVLDASVKSVNHDGDQDIVMLINPTPMINLLSSESESDNDNGCVNKQLEYERQNSEAECRLEECEQKILIEKSPLSMIPTLEYKKSENNKVDPTKCSPIIDNNYGNGQLSQNFNMKYNSDGNNKFRMENTTISSPDYEILKIEDQQDGESVFVRENKLVDEEIIDLDDYPEDMDDIENYGQISRNEKKPVGKNNITNNGGEKSENVTRLAETWATRYYQTDNVQNVMKESKIQSEIRKRLRERQKLSKLNTCSKNIPIPCINDNDKLMTQVNNQFKLTGSVQEYLALEGTNNVNRVNTRLKQTTRSLDVDDSAS